MYINQRPGGQVSTGNVIGLFTYVNKFHIVISGVYRLTKLNCIKLLSFCLIILCSTLLRSLGLCFSLRHFQIDCNSFYLFKMRKSDSNLILLIFLTSFWNYVGAAGKYVIPCLTVHEVIKENQFQKTEGYSSFNSSH